MITELHQNLKRLIDSHATAVATYSECEWNEPAKATAFVEGLPLCHSLRSDTMVQLAEAKHGLGWQLLSDTKLAEALLKLPDTGTETVKQVTANNVFLFCGQFRYPPGENACGLLFSPALETDPDFLTEASPFDTGSLDEWRSGPASSEPPLQTFQDHRLPVPEYRGLLAHRVDFLFDAAADYVTPQGRAIRPDPIGLQSKAGKPALDGSDQRDWTAEVRVETALPLETSSFAALYLNSVAFENEAVERMRAALGSRVDIQRLQPDDPGDFEPLQRKCVAWQTARQSV